MTLNLFKGKHFQPRMKVVRFYKSHNTEAFVPGRLARKQALWNRGIQSNELKHRTRGMIVVGFKFRQRSITTQNNRFILISTNLYVSL